MRDSGATSLFQRVSSLLLQVADSLSAVQSSQHKKLKQIFVRKMRGFIGECVHSWASRCSHILRQQQQGIRMVLAVVLQLVKGQSGLCVHHWNRACTKGKEAEARAVEQGQQRLQKMSWACRALERVLVKMVRGQLGLCVHDWNRACNFVKEADLRAAKEGQQHLQKMSWACRALERVLVKMVRGHLGLCVHDWNRACSAAMKASKDRIALQFTSDCHAIEQQRALQQMNWGMKTVEKVLVQLARGGKPPL